MQKVPAGCEVWDELRQAELSLQDRRRRNRIPHTDYGDLELRVLGYLVDSGSPFTFEGCLTGRWGVLRSRSDSFVRIGDGRRFGKSVRVRDRLREWLFGNGGFVKTDDISVRKYDSEALARYGFW